MATEQATVAVETTLRVVADDGVWPVRTSLSYDAAVDRLLAGGASC